MEKHTISKERVIKAQMELAPKPVVICGEYGKRNDGSQAWKELQYDFLNNYFIVKTKLVEEKFLNIDLAIKEYNLI